MEQWVKGTNKWNSLTCSMKMVGTVVDLLVPRPWDAIEADHIKARWLCNLLEWWRSKIAGMQHISMRKVGNSYDHQTVGGHTKTMPWKPDAIALRNLSLRTSDDSNHLPGCALLKILHKHWWLSVCMIQALKAVLSHSTCQILRAMPLLPFAD